MDPNELQNRLSELKAVSVDNSMRISQISELNSVRSYLPESVPRVNFDRLIDINMRLVAIIKNFFDPSVIPEELLEIDGELREIKNGW